MRQIRNFLRRNSQSFQLCLFVAALLAVLWGAILADLQRAYDEILSAGNADLTNLALAFSKEIESSVKTIDVTMIDLREHWRGDPDRFAAAVRHRQNYLEKELAFQISVIDARGMLVFSSLERTAKPIDLSDREHFRIHRERSTDELYVSKPLLGRISKRWAIQFTRPMYDERERFSGVLVLSVSPEYFYRFYRSIRMPPDSAITLVRDDGEVLSRYPNPEGALGKNLSDTPFLHPISHDAGVYRRFSQVDGVDRLYAWRRVERNPLVVAVGHSFAELTVPYREQRTRAVLAGLGLSVLLLLAGYLKLVSIKQGQREGQLLAANEERWRLALEAAGDGVWDWNVADDQVVFSAGWKKMIGHEPDEIGSDLDEWKKRVCPDDLPKVMQDLRDHFDGRTPVYANEHRIRCKDGSWKWILDRGMVIARDPAGAPLRMVGTHTDISARKQMEEMLKQIATTDALTGLANRRCFLERLEAELARVRRYPRSAASLLMADLDFFKRINDTHGHAAGDAALRHFAAVAHGAARETDVVGRLGGEEFAVLLPETGLAQAEQFGQRLCALLRETPLQFGGQAIPMSVSIGAALLEPADAGPEQVLHRADLALYEAKHQGRDRVVAQADPAGLGGGEPATRPLPV